MFSSAICLALAGEYPALIAACVAFRSIKYSSINRFCFLVNLAILHHLPSFFKQKENTAGGKQRSLKTEYLKLGHHFRVR